ncbi:MAG TPA: TetR family transcriptional regulator [Terracidiphilus sp.]|jgi:TetR/AcrR family transcriptional regulator|nr:TetR family transcriptional regulator [Terracidiphilus sp.]
MTDTNTTRSNADRSDQTRARILAAAIREFSSDGIAGARTERIAEAAGVNKALLYYYFTSKQALYDAALESVANVVVVSSMAAMGSACSAGERLVQFALNHFDRIHSNRAFQSLMQQEMMRLHRGEENALAALVEKVFRPMMTRVRQVYAEGRASGELIQVDELQIMYAALGANVFYFLSAPVMGMMTGANPFDRAALAFRRQAAVEYLGKTIFIDREHGARVAANVLAATPMPQPVEIEPQAIETGRIENHASDTLAKTHEVRRK